MDQVVPILASVKGDRRKQWLWFWSQGSNHGVLQEEGATGQAQKIFVCKREKLKAQLTWSSIHAIP